jgi:membrane fusion protein, multidrug efflux system
VPKLLRSFLPFLVVAVAAFGAWKLATAPAPPPEPTREKPAIPITASDVQPQDYTVVVQSQGEVRARTESSIMPEVSGVIVEISPSFREGGFFNAGDALVRLDDRDLKSAVTIAQSAVAQAATAVSEEKARADQAKEDWKRLGRPGEPGPLVLRVPQVAEMTARLASAQAQLDKTQRDLERTSLRAPYAGRIMEKLADVGQYVSPGRELAKIFAVDIAEIDLPVSTEDLAFLELSEHFRDDAPDKSIAGPNVTLSAQYAGQTNRWQGQIIRAASGIDRQSRQLYLTAQVRDPYARRDAENAPLKVGMWVQASIAGRTLRNVYVLPWAAVRDGNQVLVVDHESRLRVRSVTRVWSARDHVVVTAGLQPSETVCTVALHYAVEGARVKVQRQALPVFRSDGATSAAMETTASPPPTKLRSS